MSYVWGPLNEVNANRQKFLTSLDIKPSDCATMSVQDKSIIETVDKNAAGRGMFSLLDSLPVDGLVTRERGLFLMLVVADCLPIIIFDERLGLLGLAHAGWRSTEARIAKNLIHYLISQFHAQSEDLKLFIGPAIHRDSFKFVNPAQKNLPGWQDYLCDWPDGQTGIDLIGYNRAQAESAGLRPEQITDSGVDTAADSRFFSHYRDSKNQPTAEGRLACVVGLV